jgi:CheY-like chemotaxis protein
MADSLARVQTCPPPARGGKVAAIAVTAYARPEDRAQALAAGFHAHVAKPVDVATLISIVATLAGRTTAG